MLVKTLFCDRSDQFEQIVGHPSANGILDHTALPPAVTTRGVWEPVAEYSDGLVAKLRLTPPMIRPRIAADLRYERAATGWPR